MFRGRNVCMYFLLGDCIASRSCIYSHDKTYLPSGRWWGDEGKCHLLRAILDSLNPGENSAFMPYMSSILDGRIAWDSAHGVEMEEVYGHSRELARLGFRDAAENALELLAKKRKRAGSTRDQRDRRGLGKGRGGGRENRVDRYDEFESEAKERMDNFGFTEDEMMELLCQGVKPWDDDAWVSVLDSVLLRLSNSYTISGSGGSLCAPLVVNASRTVLVQYRACR